jgi:hypothetical protein
MEPLAPNQTIDLAGLKVSPETFGELTFFFHVADGFESLSEVVDLAFREWLEQQGAAIRMHQIDVQFVTDHRQEGDDEHTKLSTSAQGSKRGAANAASNVIPINISLNFRPERHT